MRKVKIRIITMPIYFLILLFWMVFNVGCNRENVYPYGDPPVYEVTKVIWGINSVEMLLRACDKTYGTFEEILKKYPDTLSPRLKEVLCTKYHLCGYWFVLYLSEKRDAWCLYAWPDKYDTWGSPIPHSGTQLIFFTWRSHKDFKTGWCQIYYLNTDKFQGPSNPPPVDFAFSGKPFESEVDEKIWNWWEHEGEK